MADETGATERRNYRPHILAAARVSVTLLVAKVASAIAIASILGVSVHFGLWKQIIPTVVFETNRTTFVSIIGWSSICTAATAVLGFLVLGLRSRSLMRCFAWAMGFLSVFELLAVDALLSHIDPPRLERLHLFVTTGLCAAGALIAVVTLSRSSVEFIRRLRESTESQNPHTLRISPQT
jgi:uncharacterized membrane protein required for colicin V production